MVEVKLLADLLVPTYSMTASFSGKLMQDGISENRSHLDTILMDTFAHVAQQSKDTLNAFATIETKLASISDIGTNHKLYGDWVRIFKVSRMSREHVELVFLTLTAGV